MMNNDPLSPETPAGLTHSPAYFACGMQERDHEHIRLPESRPRCAMPDVRQTRAGPRPEADLQPSPPPPHIPESRHGTFSILRSGGRGPPRVRLCGSEALTSTAAGQFAVCIALAISQRATARNSLARRGGGVHGDLREAIKVFGTDRLTSIISSEPGAHPRSSQRQTGLPTRQHSNPAIRRPPNPISTSAPIPQPQCHRTAARHFPRRSPCLRRT